MSRGRLLRQAALTAAASTLTVGMAGAVTAPAYASDTTTRPRTVAANSPSLQPAQLPALMATSEQFAAMLRQMSGPQLEKTYMGAMVRHHQMAIDMARVEPAKGSRPAEKALARRIIRPRPARSPN